MDEGSPNPSDTPRDAGSDAIDENEIDRVLAEAMDLTKDLQNEVGVAPAEPEEATHAEHDSQHAPPDESIPDVDLELSDIEAMLADLSESAKPVEEGEPGEGDVDASDAQGVQASAEETAAVGSDSPADALEPSEEESAPARARRSILRSLHPSAVRELVAPIAPSCRMALSTATDTTVRVLDVIDGVFAWVNYGVRRILGWVAAAIMVAAISIAAFSFS